MSCYGQANNSQTNNINESFTYTIQSIALLLLRGKSWCDGKDIFVGSKNASGIRRHPSQLHMITLIREPSIIFLKAFWCAMFASQLLRLIGERKSWGLLCSMQGRAENSCNYCFLNQKDDLRLLWLWKLLIKLRRSGRRHFCIAKSSFKDLDHKISETRIWGVLTSTPVTLSFTLSMKVARNAGSLL